MTIYETLTLIRGVITTLENATPAELLRDGTPIYEMTGEIREIMLTALKESAGIIVSEFETPNGAIKAEA